MRSRYGTAFLIMGARASGKSTVGRRVAAGLFWPYLSFGAYARGCARAQGLALEAPLLEELGGKLVDERGYKGLLADLIDECEGEPAGVVIDGVRHVEMLQRVRNLFVHVLGVYVEVPYELRYARWLQREGITRSKDSLFLFEQLSAGVVERHVPKLRKLATHVVDGSQPIDLLVSSLTNLLDCVGTGSSTEDP
jgi:adenylate kinase family enzyme